MVWLAILIFILVCAREGQSSECQEAECQENEEAELLKVSLLQGAVHHRTRRNRLKAGFDAERTLRTWVQCGSKSGCMTDMGADDLDADRFGGDSKSHVREGEEGDVVVRQWAGSRQKLLLQKWNNYLDDNSQSINHYLPEQDEFLDFVRSDYRLDSLCDNIPELCGNIGHNSLSLRSLAELTSMAHGLSIEGAKDPEGSSCKVINGTSLGNIPPSSIDWLERGMMTEVLNQDPCQTCWSFAGASTIASQLAIAEGRPPRQLDNQEMVNCINRGFCEEARPGGTLSSPFDFVLGKCGLFANISLGGLCGGSVCPFREQTNSEYFSYLLNSKKGRDENFFTGWMKEPVVPADAARCSPSCTAPEPVMAPGCQLIMDGEPGLLHAVTKGPVSTGICFPEPLWYWNSSSIFGLEERTRKACNACSFFGTNHAVVLTGYGSEGGHDYWLIKNSYGKDWGIPHPTEYKGYFKLARGFGACNIGMGLVPQMRAARLAL